MGDRIVKEGEEKGQEPLIYEEHLSYCVWFRCYSDIRKKGTGTGPRQQIRDPGLGRQVRTGVMELVGGLPILEEFSHAGAASGHILLFCQINRGRSQPDLNCATDKGIFEVALSVVAA
jgi:hypothetical protein